MPGKPKDKQKNFKYAQIKTDLSIQILEGQLRPHDRIPSLNEIAARYKVSKITARRVLNDLVTEGLVYASRGRGSFVADIDARQQASRLKASPQQQLGVVFEHAAGSFMTDIIMGIDEEARSHGVQMNLCLSNNTHERERENLEWLVGQGIDRILLFMVLQNDATAINANIPLYLRLQEQGVALLLLACHLPGVAIPSVTYGDYEAYQSLVKLLAGRGCRELLYVSRDDNASTTAERRRGYLDGLLENTLPYSKKRMIDVRLRSYDTVSSDTQQAITAYFDSGASADAIVCSDELVAAGVFDALEARGRPRKTWPQVAGMGAKRNLHVLKGNPYILLEDDTHRLGREAARLMLKGKLPDPNASDRKQLRLILPVPIRLPRKG